MSFEMAYLAMLNGKKVHSTRWESGDYIFIEKNKILCDGGFAFAGMLTPEDITGTWAIYQE